MMDDAQVMPSWLQADAKLFDDAGEFTSSADVTGTLNLPSTSDTREAGPSCTYRVGLRLSSTGRGQPVSSTEDGAKIT